MTDLRPEALLKLVNDGEATWEWVAKSSATLRALAAQQTETPPESERQRFEAWAAVQALALRRIHDDDDAGMDYVNTHTDASWEAWKARAALAAPSQPMAGEPLAALLRDCREREYNPFEPDNQSRLYHRIVAALAQPMAGEPEALLREALAKWMIAYGFTTGHGDTQADLLAELGPQIEALRQQVRALHREASTWNAALTAVLREREASKNSPLVPGLNGPPTAEQREMLADADAKFAAEAKEAREDEYQYRVGEAP
jgi:hypothetical protein